MTFDVFAYDFPHWKTIQGLTNLVANGYRPRLVILAPKKELNIPTSKYRMGPIQEFWTHPQMLCKALGLDFVVKDHDTITGSLADFAVILGARILKQHTIDAYKDGIINIHPGILPGNRGLDNVKWAIIKQLPIGCTAHYIDSRVDMGWIIRKNTIRIEPDMELREVVHSLRAAEMATLIEAMDIVQNPLSVYNMERVEHSEKFSAVPDHIDRFMPNLWEGYKKAML